MSEYDAAAAALTALTAGFAFVFGAVIASFLCVVVERIPRGESINGRSHCVCGRQLSAWENIPVVSWLVLRGRSRCCGERIPTFYVLAEAGLGAAWALGVLVFGTTWPALAVVLVSTVVLLVVGFRRARPAGA